jgi:hypothetical protein
MSTNFLKNILLLFCCFFLKTNSCFAWNGYENYSGEQIEIGSGNLVREGEVIKFYDWGSQEDRNAEVRSVDYLFNTTRLEIYDFVDEKIRVFDMDN